ncbi:hypothetical protein GOP47_0031101, partial [Adiantum capillus-veneris]
DPYLEGLDHSITGTEVVDEGVRVAVVRKVKKLDLASNWHAIRVRNVVEVSGTYATNPSSGTRAGTPAAGKVTCGVGEGEGGREVRGYFAVYAKCAEPAIGAPLSTRMKLRHILPQKPQIGLASLRTQVPRELKNPRS